MKPFFSLESLVSKKESCDFSKATWNSKLSSTGLDKESKTFWATVDKFAFVSPLEIISEVLTSNGYTINLENLLGCYEQLRIGIRAIFAPAKPDQQIPVVKEFNYCVLFPLPTKQRVGDLLKIFYDEIAFFEEEISRLKGKQAPKREISKGELKKELKNLEEQNRQLKDRVKELSTNLATLRKEHEQVSQIMESKNLLPPNMRLGKTTAIHVEDRYVAIRSAGISLRVPMAYLNAMPEPGDRCLVFVDEGIVKSAYFFEKSGTLLDPLVGKVLYVKDDTIKIRDARRKTHVLHSRNVQERDLIKKLSRGTKILIYLYQGQVIRIQSCRTPDTTFREMSVLEAMATQQILQLNNEGNKEKRSG